MPRPRAPLVVTLLAALYGLAGPAACGDASAPARGPRSDVAGGAAPPPASAARAPGRAPAPHDTGTALAAPAGDTPAPDAAPVGHLERRDRLDRFFEALARLEAGGASDDVRIVQYGDSHTASDCATSVVRRALQARFGDGGRGFVSLGRPWKTYAQDGIRGGMTDGFEPLRVWFHKGQFEGEGGAYGLLGVGVAASHPGERAWTDVAARASRVELDYWQWPAGGSFEVLVDGAPAGRVSTRAAAASSGFRALEVADGPHQIELRTGGDGEVRVFGMTLDRAQAGVVVDALGINGAEVFTPLRWSEAHFAEQLRHRAPGLVILAYGTNESLDGKLTDAEYERGVVDLLGRVARAAPAASCLLLGPTDLAVRGGGREPARDGGKAEGWVPWGRITEIVQIQRRLARAAGCAFYDQLEAMGGPGSIVAWASEPEPRAAPDHVHFTRAGYALLGTSFADDLLRGYDDWRAERGLSPAGAGRPPGVARR